MFLKSRKKLSASFAAAVALGLGACQDQVFPSAPENAAMATSSVSFDRAHGRTCASMDDRLGMKSFLTHLSQDMDLMESLPITGAPVHAGMAGSALTLCSQPAKGMGDMQGYYQVGQSRLVVSEEAGTSTSLHEIFHAHQDVARSAFRAQDERLTPRDEAFANLLGEASAVAYELVVQQEMAERGIDVPRLGKHGGTGNSRRVRQHFSAHYKQALSEIEASRDVRIAYALRHAGRAVVEYLISGESNFWREYYSTQAIHNASNVETAQNDCAVGYAARRAALFKAEGQVTGELNFIPERYLGVDAETHIRRDIAIFVNVVKDANTCDPVIAKTRVYAPSA